MRTCKCGGVIREYGRPYFDTLESCTCSNPEAVKTETYISTTTTMPPNTKKCDGTCRTPECYTPEKEKCKSCNDFGFWTDASGKPHKCNEASHAKPTPTPAVEDWEKEVWSWITKEMPHKHADRFIPLFEIIRSLRESDRKRILKWAEKEKRHDILYFSDLVAFITNLK